MTECKMKKENRLKNLKKKLISVFLTLSLYSSLLNVICERENTILPFSSSHFMIKCESLFFSFWSIESK